MNNEIEIPLRRFKTLLVVDLEATCWADGRGPREDMETIEFGAVLVRMQDLKPVDARSWFIKPKLHPQLSEFCTELTSITQSQVDAGLSFEAMSAQVATWLEPHRERLGWGSWGNYDKHQLQKDAQRLGMLSPLELCGLLLEGVHHRGIDDARNVARILPWLMDPKLKGTIVRRARSAAR